MLRRLLALVLTLALTVAAVRPVDARCATGASGRAMDGMAMEHGGSPHTRPMHDGAASTDCAASLHCAAAAPTIAAPVVAVVAVGIEEPRAQGALLGAIETVREPEFPPPRG